MKYLYKLCDLGEGDPSQEKPAWKIRSAFMSENLPEEFFPGEEPGVGDIVRLEWGREIGETITSPGNYQNFAKLCSIFVEHSPGFSRWVIGNEPNRAGILHDNYARCFLMCREAIRKVRPHDLVFLAAVAPIPDPYGNPWQEYFSNLLHYIGYRLDGFIAHIYSTGDDVEFCQLIPEDLHRLPVYALSYDLVEDPASTLSGPPFVQGDAAISPSAVASPVISDEDTLKGETMKQAEYLTEEEVILAFRSALGNTAIAAKSLGISRGQLQDYIVNHPAVREERNQIKEALKDDAEDQLVVRMRNSDQLLIFFLRTQARERGYEPNISLSGSDGKPLSLSVDARSLISAMRQGLTEESNGKESSGKITDEASSVVDGG